MNWNLTQKDNDELEKQILDKQNDLKEKYFKNIVNLLLISLLLTQNALAETKSSTYSKNEHKTQVIYLKNGSSIIGDIVQKNSSEIKIKFFKQPFIFKPIKTVIETVDFMLQK